MLRINKKLYIIVLSILLVQAGSAAQKPHQDVSYSPPSAAIASASKQATDAGMAIFEQGGNAFDAAVTVAAVLAVTEPYNSGLGGGGYWLIHHAATDAQFVIDSREVAPKAATPDMYLDPAGQPIKKASFEGALAAAIPGEPAAIIYLAQNYGRLPLSITLAPAIHYAEKGFLVDQHYRKIVERRLTRLQNSATAAKVFLKDNQTPKLGYRIVQPELAATLKLIAEKGHAGFYQGKLAKQLIQGVDDAGGIWQLSDLLDYRIKIKKPLQSTYHDIQLTTVPLSSGGGITIINILNILAGYDFNAITPIEKMHVIIEAMRRAYFDRVQFLGDEDYTRTPVKTLTSLQHANNWRKTIDLHKVTPSQQLSTMQPTVTVNTEGHTTHFSILDREGNAVATTLSLNYRFGSAFVVPGTGVLLNNHMDDFSVKPGAPNVYGLVGSQANAIAPGKRPLSSMAPLFLTTKNKFAILGTPGGSRIPSMLVLAILDFAQNHGAQSWVSVPRYHHQYLPDHVQFEQDGLTNKQQQQLRKQGYQLKKIKRKYGDMQAILWDKQNNQVTAASDPRGNGKASIQ